MKLSKEELLTKINDLEIGDEIKMSLLEDIADSMDVAEDNTALVEEITQKYEELKEKYKARFLGGEEKDEKEEKDEEVEELKEEEVIDVKEI